MKPFKARTFVIFDSRHSGDLPSSTPDFGAIAPIETVAAQLNQRGEQ